MSHFYLPHQREEAYYLEEHPSLKEGIHKGHPAEVHNGTPGKTGLVDQDAHPCVEVDKSPLGLVDTLGDNLDEVVGHPFVGFRLHLAICGRVIRWLVVVRTNMHPGFVSYRFDP